MAEYIKRDKSLLIYLSNDAYEQVMKVPAADVVPVRHGRWIEIEDGKIGHLRECSSCEEWALFYYGYTAKYCPNCGCEDAYVESYEHHVGAIRYRVCCPKCGVYLDSGYWQTADRAIEEWNKRSNSM